MRVRYSRLLGPINTAHFGISSNHIFFARAKNINFSTFDIFYSISTHTHNRQQEKDRKQRPGKLQRESQRDESANTLTSF